MSGLMKKLKEWPRDVTLRGAGMNSTLLLCNELSTKSIVRNLAIEDMTINAEGYLTDLRREAATIVFDRVRAIGFDKGAGSSCLLSAPSLAVLARDSVFEGGYGKSPRSGQIFDVRSNALMARFERCSFDTVSLEISRFRSEATVVLDNCRFTNCTEWGGKRNTEIAIQQHPGIVLSNTTIEYHEFSPEPGVYREPPKKELNDLFPDWKGRLVR